MSDVGPLTLQLSNVAGAVNDLVTGYDQLIGTLPNLEEKVVSMQARTEGVARHLEGQMKELIDGYDYLSSLSTMVPEDIRIAAETHKKGLLRNSSVSLCSPKGTTNPNAMIDSDVIQLEQFRHELQGIAYERMVSEVLSRRALPTGYQKYRRKNSYNNGISGGGNSSNSQPASRPHSNNPLKPNSATRSIQKPMVLYRQPSQNSLTQSELYTSLASSKLPRSDDPSFIHLPTYTPGAGGSSILGNFQSNTRPFMTSSSDSRPVPLRVKPVAGAMLTPSVRQGTLPAELLGLKVPSTTSPPYSQLQKQTIRKSRTNVNMSNRYIQEHLKRTEAELKEIDSLLRDDRARQEKDRARAAGQLRHLEATLNKQRVDIETSTSHMLGEAVRRIEEIASGAQGQLSTTLRVVTSDAPIPPASKPNPPTPARQPLPSLDSILSTYKVIPVRSTSKGSTHNQPHPQTSTPVIKEPTVIVLPLSIPSQRESDKENTQTNVAAPSSSTFRNTPNPNAGMETLMAELMASQRQANHDNQALLQTVVEHTLNIAGTNEHRLGQEIELSRERLHAEQITHGAALQLGSRFMDSLEVLAEGLTGAARRQVEVQTAAFASEATRQQSLAQSLVESVSTAIKQGIEQALDGLVIEREDSHTQVMVEEQPIIPVVSTFRIEPDTGLLRSTRLDRDALSYRQTDATSSSPTITFQRDSAVNIASNNRAVEKSMKLNDLSLFHRSNRNLSIQTPRLLLASSMLPQPATRAMQEALDNDSMKGILCTELASELQSTDTTLSQDNEVVSFIDNSDRSTHEDDVQDADTESSLSNYSESNSILLELRSSKTMNAEENEEDEYVPSNLLLRKSY